MTPLTSLPFTVDAPGTPATITFTKGDGTKWEMKFTMVVMTILDTGMTNPLDGTPMLNVQAQTVAQIGRKTDG